jgi:hypothetical protein
MEERKIRNYEISVPICVTAHSEDEALAIAYKILLSGGNNCDAANAAEPYVSEASLDGLFEDEPKANLNDLFDEGESDAN